MTVHLCGRFGNTSSRPYIEGSITFPRLKVQGSLSFLVDSGADRTMLMPDDGQRLEIDYALLQNPQPCGGAGGQFTAFDEPALIVFAEEKKQLFIYLRTVSILPIATGMRGTPSLLGRDILDLWEWKYCGSKNLLEFEVLSADVIMPIPALPTPTPPAANP